MFRLQFVLVATLVSLSGHAADSEVPKVPCGATAALATLSLEVRLILETNERPASAVTPLPVGRLAYGTSIGEGPGSGLVVGGRIVVQDWEHANPVLTLEPPSADGKPSYVRVVVASPDHRTLAITGGYMFGGPVLMYGTDPFEFRFSTQETRRPLDFEVDQFVNLFRAAANGDAFAQADIAPVDPSGQLMKLFRADADRFRTLIEEQFTREAAAGGERNTPQNIPAMAVHFNADGSRYVVSAGDFASIRAVSDGRQLKRVSLYAPSAPRVLDPPTAYFLGGGTHLASLSREWLTVWNAETGMYLGAERHGGEIEAIFAPIVTSPDAKFLSVAFKGKDSNWRSIWALDKNQRLRVVRDISSLHTENSKDRFPVVAFSRANLYAFGTPGGIVELVDPRDESTRHHYLLGRDVPINEVALSSDGKWLAVDASRGDGEFIELRATDSLRGVHLTLPTPPAGKVSFVKGLQFTPEGSRLVVEVVTYDPKDASGAQTTTPYLVDVYRTFALLPSQPK